MENEYLITVNDCSACGCQLISKIIYNPTIEEKEEMESKIGSSCCVVRLFKKDNDGFFIEVESSSSEYGWKPELFCI